MNNLNIVKWKQAKDADRPEPKGNVAGHSLFGWECTDRMLPVDRLDLTHHVTYAKHGKPVSPPDWVGRP